VDDGSTDGTGEALTARYGDRIRYVWQENEGEAVAFWGSVPHAVVAATMQQARAFAQHSLQTSYGDSEGTPVAVLEARVAGLPREPALANQLGWAARERIASEFSMDKSINNL